MAVTAKAGSGGTKRSGGGNRRQRPSLQEQARSLAQQRARRVRRQRLLVAAGAMTAALVAVIAMVVIRSTMDKDGGSASAGTDAATATKVIRAAATVPASVLDRVGRGKTSGGPRAVSDQPALTEGGKPLVVYIGAEYCPFCASQRWAVVVALSRFGTFADLGLTHSASDDVYPDTQTFTFHGARYTSQYLAFQGVEVATNEREGQRYAPLDRLTDQQQHIMETLNAPPYVPEDSAGAIPFMDFGNKHIMLGGAYDAQVLQGKTAEQIAAALSRPEDPIAQGILGTANMFTAVLCELTGGQPGQVCGGAAAKAYQGTA